MIENLTFVSVPVDDPIKNLASSIRYIELIVKELEKPYIIIYGPLEDISVREACGPVVYVYKSQITWLSYVTGLTRSL